MLREIPKVRQDDPSVTRRWFQDDYFDLWVWQSPRGEIVAFQLCYDRRSDEKALTWRTEYGFDHLKVRGSARIGTRGQLNVTEAFFAPGVKPRLRAAAKSLPTEVKRVLMSRLREYLGGGLILEPARPRISP